MRFRRFVFATRGLYLLLAQASILWLKSRTGATVGWPVYRVLLAVVLAAQLFRTWAAGFVGTTARERETRAEVLLTAGPYAHVRNPMYLGNFVITTALAGMSGLWYGPPIAWAAYAFVYANVIPYEEAYLRRRFGQGYEDYVRGVPRLIPTRRGYPLRTGMFQLREGLANEIAAWVGVLVFGLILYRP